jgi:hypothetical protein
MFTFLARLVCGYVIYSSGFDPGFGYLPLVTIILLLVLGAGADANWRRFRRSQ